MIQVHITVSGCTRALWRKGFVIAYPTPPGVASASACASASASASASTTPEGP